MPSLSACGIYAQIRVSDITWRSMITCIYVRVCVCFFFICVCIVMITVIVFWVADHSSKSTDSLLNYTWSPRRQAAAAASARRRSDELDLKRAVELYCVLIFIVLCVKQVRALDSSTQFAFRVLTDSVDRRPLSGILDCTLRRRFGWLYCRLRRSYVR